MESVSRRPTPDAHGVAMDTNLTHAQFEQVQKEQVYHLAEVPGESFDETYQIATCDMRLLEGSDQDIHRFAGQLVAGLREIGFVYLVGHGIDTALFDQGHDETVKLFTEVGLEEKLRYRAQRFGSVNQGYFPYQQSTRAHPDLVEGWVFARRAFQFDGASSTPADFWPAPSQEPFFRTLYQASERLILPIMRSILRGLGCDPHSFDDKLTKPHCALRLNYYPPIDAAAAASGAGRLLGHEDATLLTFLPASRVEGLQVYNRDTQRWIRLHPPPGTLILNAGDYLQMISNNVLRSSTHRVALPRDARQLTRARTSFPLFVYLREEEILEVLPCFEKPVYAPIDALTFHTRVTRKFYGADYANLGENQK